MSEPASPETEVTQAAVQLRRATQDDAVEIHRMVRELALFLGEETKHSASPEDYARDGFGDKPRFECILAEVAGEAVGMCLCFDSYSTWLGKPGFYVQDLIVSSKARGLGVGRLLMRHVARMGKERGYAYIRLSVDAQNSKAQGFYETCGLNWSASEKIYFVKNEGFVALAEEA